MEGSRVGIAAGAAREETARTMIAPNLKSDEGRALALILSVLGEYGRGAVREHLLARVTDDGYGEDALQSQNGEGR